MTDKILNDVKCFLESHASQLHKPSLETVLNVVEAIQSDASDISELYLNFEICDSVTKLAHQQFYVVPYYQVDISWREMYTVSQLLKSLFKLLIYKLDVDREKEDLVEAISIADEAIVIAGAPIFRQELHGLISECERLWSSLQENKIQYPVLNFDKIDRLEPKSEYPFIEKVHLPSLDQFNHFKKLEQPIIITGAMDQWPALGKWTNSEILSSIIGPFRKVPVEFGSSYTDENWTQKLVFFEEFMEMMAKPKGINVPYLAQHNLLSQVPKLQQDVLTPDYTALGDKETRINVWIGPAGTVSPLHHDSEAHNMLCQVAGYKYIVLIPPCQTENVYPFKNQIECEEGTFAAASENTSRVDLLNPDYEKHPKFLEAERWAMQCILAPGEILYIPPNYWHYVKSLSTSISVSFWF